MDWSTKRGNLHGTVRLHPRQHERRSGYDALQPAFQRFGQAASQHRREVRRYVQLPVGLRQFGGAVAPTFEVRRRDRP